MNRILLAVGCLLAAGVAADSRAGVELAKRFDAANGADAAIVKQLGIEAIPTMLVVDTETNRPVAAVVGFQPAHTLRAVLTAWRSGR